MATPQNFQPPPGTRDFYPDQMALRRYIEDTWRRDVSLRHGFVEVDGPTFEYLDLYKVKSGDEIVSQLFHFESREDRSGKTDQFALRPEFTPTLARMIAAKANSLPRPIKWFSIPRCYRAERQQKGRLKEFFQWNVDMISERTEYRSMREAMAVCMDALREFGFMPSEVCLAWNNRAVMNKALESHFNPEQIPAIVSLIDKLEKLDEDQRRYQCSQLGLSDSQNAFLNEISKGILPSSDSTDQLLLEFERQSREVGISEFCRFDPRIVRGLAYYTGYVFEVVDAEQRNCAVAGGGQYNELIELFGGPSLSASGFGMGDVVLEILLREKGKLPASLLAKPEVFVISVLDDPTPSQQIISQLRMSQWNVEHSEITRPGIAAITSYKTTKNIGKLLQEAAASGAKIALILAPAEFERGIIKLKNLASRDEREVPAADAMAAIRAALRDEGT